MPAPIASISREIGTLLDLPDDVVDALIACGRFAGGDASAAGHVSGYTDVIA